MLRISRIILVILVTVVAASYLPWLFQKAFDKKVEIPFILYSIIRDEFVYRLSDEYGTVIYRDESGNEYDRVAYENLVPFFYYKNLQKWGTLPEEIHGLKVDYDLCRSNLQSVRISPDYIHTPAIDLYPLFESQSKFTSLEYPPEMFRLTQRMEFIDAVSNEVNEELSNRFTAALEEAGFVFPASFIAGNPSTRKPFDEGYLAADARGQVFHLKKVEGEPLCVNTGLRPESGIRYMSVKENARKEFYGMMITGDDRVHLISYDDYRLIELPLEGYDPDTMSLQMITDPLRRTFIFRDQEPEEIYCVLTDLDYSVLRTYTYPVDRGRNRLSEILFSSLFPFVIERRNPDSDYVLFNLRTSGIESGIGIVAALILLALVRRVRVVKRKESWIDWLLVACTGLYGFIAIMLVGKEPPAPSEGAA